jgi:outer membrane receptor for ferrienterochelin and colicins
MNTVLLFGLASLTAEAAPETGVVTGTITDANTGEPLPQACVLLQKTHYGAAADLEGEFIIYSVPPGTYDAVASLLGYASKRNVTVEVTAGEETVVNFELTPGFLHSEDVTVTATRGPSLIQDVPSSVNVIDMELVRRENPQNISEVLDDVQGVFIKDYGGIGGQKSISLRGSSSEQVLVLLDGQRLNKAQSGGVDLSTISLEGVEKIEVVRGGNSALYGADAVGGVINIITKKQEDEVGLRGRVELMAGSFSSYTGETSLKLLRKTYSAEVSIRQLTSEGDYEYTDRLGVVKNRINNDVLSRDLFSRLSLKLGTDVVPRDLDLSYRFSTSDRGSPGDITNVYPNSRIKNRTHQVNTSFNGPFLGPLNNLNIQTYAHFNYYHYDNPDLITPVDDEYRSGTFGGEVQYRQVLTPDLSLTYGGGGRHEWIRSDSFDGSPVRSSSFGYLQGESKFYPDFVPGLQSISFIPAGRVDSYSDFGVNASPKIGAVLNFFERYSTALKANAGLSYRAPTFNDLYWPEDAFAIGNPDLEPEHGVDWDVGVRMQWPVWNGISAEATYFHNRMDNLIIWQEGAGAGGKWAPANVTNALLRGVESSFTMHPIQDLMTLRANYTYLEASDLDRDLPLVYRPRDTINGTVTFSWHGAALSYSQSYVSRRYYNPNNDLLWLDPYRVSDVTLSYRTRIWGEAASISMQAKNLFDEEFQIINHQPVPGREYRVTIGLTFDQKSETQTNASTNPGR